MFKRFQLLNGDIDCRVLKQEVCPKDWTYLTDYVFFNNEFILDYYEDSETIVLTYDKEGKEIRSELMKLRDDFFNGKGNYESFPQLTDGYINDLKLKTYEELKDTYK